MSWVGLGLGFLEILVRERSATIVFFFQLDFDGICFFFPKTEEVWDNSGLQVELNPATWWNTFHHVETQRRWFVYVKDWGPRHETAQPRLGANSCCFKRLAGLVGCQIVLPLNPEGRRPPPDPWQRPRPSLRPFYEV